MIRARPRILLMIGDSGIVIVPYHMPGIEPFYVSTSSRHAVTEILDFIARHPTARITLCADNLAQDYRADTLPRLNFFDRAKLARRRLKQYFPAARLTAFVKQKSGACLMTGLHESNPVFGWAERLRARLPHILLLPVEGAAIAAQLLPDAQTDWRMIVSRHKSGGFRQIVTLNNELIFTRLTPLPDTRNGEDEVIARDIKASLDYLTRHGLRNAADLAVLLLITGDIGKSAALQNLPVKSITALSPFLAAQKLRLPFAPQENDSAGDLFYAAYILSKRRGTLPLMLPETRQQHRMQMTQQWGMRLATLALVAALANSGWRASNLAQDFIAARRESIQLVQTRHELATLQADAAPVTEPLGRLRQAIERQRIYAAPTPTPWQALNELATSPMDEAQISKIDWQKPADTSPEILTLAVRLPPPAADSDRADSVAAFSRVAQNIAHAMPDYTIAATTPPYPALPQESVSAEPKTKTEDPVGEIILQRRVP